MRAQTSRLIVVALAVAALSGCSTSPVSVAGIVPRSAPDPFSCATRQINLMGYIVEAGDREAGYVRGRKKTSGAAAAILGGANLYDVMTASVFADPSTEAVTLRVTVAGVQESTYNLIGGGTQAAKPSKEGQAEAEQLLKECGALATTEGRVGADTVGARRS